MRANMSRYDAVIGNPSDWEGLPIDAVVDPMLFRIADVFVGGRTGKEEADSDIWSVLSQNRRSIVAFFDILAFSEQLPLIDYGLTFERREGYEVSRLYDLINNVHGDLPNAGHSPTPLVSVHVEGDAHDEARGRAIAMMREHRQGMQHMDAESANKYAVLKQTIAYELHAFEYAWMPDLTEFDARYTWEYDSPDRQVDTFLYGGLLFGNLAYQAGVPHLLYGLRGKLDQAVALNAALSFRYGEEVDVDEAALDKELTHELQASLTEAKIWKEGMRALPPVLTYLLQAKEPESITELLLRALELRATDMMTEYRHWKNQAVDKLQKTGAVPADVRRDIRAAAKAVAAHLEPASPTWKGWKTTLGIVPLPALPAPWKERLWNWALSTIPGRNHLKMLYRLQLAHIAAGAGELLDRPLKRLWSAEPAAR